MAIPSWITVNPTSGSGNKTVSITVDKNIGTTERTWALVVRTAGGVAKAISIVQKAAQAHLEWLQEPLWEVDMDKANFAYLSTQAIIKNLPENFNVESVEAQVFSVNGEEDPTSPTITRFSGEEVGMEIGMSIDSYDSANKTANATFSITITNYTTLNNWFDIQANGSGTADDPYHGTLGILIGLTGPDGELVETNEITLSIYDEFINSEITLSPESQDLPLGDMVEFSVDYADMLGGTITFNPGPEMQNSDGAVYMDNWTGDTSSDPTGKNNSGTIRFYINAFPYASEGTYTFEIMGKNNKGQTYSVPGEVYVS
jgi:hypothetical protein